MKSQYDVVILGAGHNGLVAAAYLGRAGLSVLLLEKNDYIGGATTSQRIFPDYDASISRYSYLVSLLPEKIIRDLGLRLELRRRTIASFTPYVRNGAQAALLLSNVSEAASRQSSLELTGNSTEFDLLRGLVLTDAKIGIFTHPHDESLLQNRCFIYHLIGNRTGEWKVPVGGMGKVAGELKRVSEAAGAEMLTRVRLNQLHFTNGAHTIEFDSDEKSHTIDARFVLINFGPNILAKFFKKPYQPDATHEGSVLKINMLLQRLPRLRASQYPVA